MTDRNRGRDKHTNTRVYAHFISSIQGNDKEQVPELDTWDKQ